MIIQGVSNAFKYDMLARLASDVIRIALYTSQAELNESLMTYLLRGEVEGPGYKAGGIPLVGFRVTTGVVNVAVGPGLSRAVTVAMADWEDPTWPNATIIARGALIYNASQGNRTIGILDFGEDYLSKNGSFTVVLPEATPETALIQIR